MGIRSGMLLGRHNALPVYAVIAELPKPEFTTGQVARLASISGTEVSKEMRRLVDLGLVVKISRRGDYRRVEADFFWPWVAVLARQWHEEVGTAPVNTHDS